MIKSENYIEFENVSRRFKSIKAVDGLSFTVKKGDIYGFLGPNGSGKSTSLRMLLSLIKPDSGAIKLFGHDLAYERKLTLSKIGALIEKPDFYEYLPAQKNLELLGRINAVKDLGGKIGEVLKLVGLFERRKSKVRTFSQGMRQRLGIAQSLLHDPELIILDEPANGLDPQGQQEIRSLIKHINTEKGITIILSSHILYEIEQIANRMVIINKGKKLVEGEVQELLYGSGMKVSFETPEPEKAREALENSNWNEKIVKNNNGRFVFNISKDDITPLTEFLIQSGVELFAVEPAKSLEDFFLNMTKND